MSIRTILPFAILLIVALGGCATEEAALDSSAAAPIPVRALDATGAAARSTGPALSDYSLYDLEAEWWDRDGTVRSLNSLSGRVQVLAMVYTNCGHSCPRILGDMKKIESELGPDYDDRVGFVLASLDSERDTPERLRQYGSDLRLEDERWTLLGADASTVLELAAVLDIRYRRESESEYSHTNQIFVLSDAGELAYRMNVGEGATRAVQAIRDLVDRNAP